MSYLFDANSERITGAFTSNYDYPISFACWVKKDDASWGSTSDGMMTLGETALDQTDSLAMLNPSPTDRVNATATDSGDANTSASYDFTTDAYNDEWVLVYAIFTASNDKRIGIENWANSNQTAGTTTLTGTLDQIMLGNRDTGGSGHLDGFLAECCIWDKALVEADIDALQTAAEIGAPPNTVQPGNAIGYWPLDKDDTTQSNEGTDAGGALTVSGATYNADHPTINSPGPVIESQTSNTINSPVTQIELTKPSGVVAGDALLIIVANDATIGTAQWDDTTYNPRLASDGEDAGWEFVYEGGNTNTDCHIGVFIRIADGTEEATVDVDCLTATGIDGSYVRISGVNETTPVNVQNDPDTTSTVNGTVHTIPEVTTDEDNCLAFYVLAFDGGDGSPFSVDDSIWKEGDDIGGFGVDLTWGTREMAVAGLTTDAVVNSTGADKTHYFQFALNAAVEGGAFPYHSIKQRRKSMQTLLTM